MKRGELYLVRNPRKDDPRRQRVFAVLSRQVLINSRFSTVVCAPVYSVGSGLSTQVPVGIEEGLKHDSSLNCDELVSLDKSKLTHFVGVLSREKLEAVERAVIIALGFAESR